MGQRIIVGLAVGMAFAIGSCIVGVIVATLFTCCFESNVFYGLMVIDPWMGVVGGLLGLVAGLNLSGLLNFATTWRQSHWFKVAVVLMIILLFVWGGVVAGR